MSTTKVDATTCDLCGYGGAWSRPEDFQQFAGGVDLCRWCADDRPSLAGQTLECGRHLVTFTEESWSCSCGASHSRPIFLLNRVRSAVPNIVLATANNHVQS